jgi:hypothetical protein
MPPENLPLSRWDIPLAKDDALPLTRSPRRKTQENMAVWCDLWVKSEEKRA